MRILKRTTDIVASFLGLLVLSPLLGSVAIVVHFSSPGPVLFKQPRAGLNGRRFTMFKFRTMSEERDAGGELLPDKQRETKVGTWLRKTSFDELPELYNVLRGDMSLVGPRPLLLEYLPLYSEEQARRHEMRPGISGLAQVNGRNATTWEERLTHDVSYVDSWSYYLDMRILWMTITTVVSRKGVDRDAGETMPKFDGGKDHT